jgi:predicted RNA-binding Zn ribbon-like protein
MTEEIPKVRGGGRATGKGYLFELTGGNLCLDFANTVDCRPTKQRRELLNEYGDLISWGRQAGALTRREIRHLLRRAAACPREAASVLEKARLLREAIFQIVAAAAAGAQVPVRALEVINADLPKALTRLRLARAADGFAWDWADDLPVDRVLWPVLRSAGDLLTSDELGRVRECASDRCAWLFLDRSRNRSRRWCDMSVCGNRDKARRHYQRSRANV